MQTPTPRSASPEPTTADLAKAYDWLAIEQMDGVHASEEERMAQQADANARLRSLREKGEEARAREVERARARAEWMAAEEQRRAAEEARKVPRWRR